MNAAQNLLNRKFHLNARQKYQPKHYFICDSRSIKALLKFSNKNIYVNILCLGACRTFVCKGKEVKTKSLVNVDPETLPPPPAQLEA